MDNQDKIIKNILSSFDDESVPLSFESKIFKKIQSRSAARESRRETLQNYIMLIIIASVFAAALLVLNHYFFRINLNLNFEISTLSQKIQDTSALFISVESLKWIGIGTNIALLLLCERIISEKLRKRDTEKS